MKSVKVVMMSVFAVLAVSSNAFAAKSDLKIFNTLLSVGVESEQFMSQSHVGVDEVSCALAHQSGEYDCHLFDISADEGQGATLNLTGAKAARLYELLENIGAQSDNGMGRIYLSVQSIRCSQANKHVSDGTAAQRTSCSVDSGEDQL